jgi:hypothetical protein
MEDCYIIGENRMRRSFLALLLLALLLVSCGGGPSDTTVPEPPQSQVFTSSDNAKVNEILTGWQREIPATMQQHAVKPETIEEKIFVSTASVQEVADFYQQQLIQKGWIRAPRMPNVQGNFLITGYEGGNYDLVIGAFDGKEFGSTGTYVYTAKGSR